MTTKQNPEVTVLMPVYNGEKYLKEAMISILNQSFQDFEFIIINDASTDNSAEVIKQFDDKRIRYFENSENLCLSRTLNKGLNLSKGNYVARMDQDDISLLDRLEKQLNFLENNKEYGICGSFIENFGAKEGIEIYPVIDELIRIHLLFYSTFAHPSVMFRKSFFEKFNLFYNSEFEYCEDYDLWSRAKKHFKLANINEVLLKYRVHSTGMSVVGKNKQDKMADFVRNNQLKDIGINSNSEELRIHHSLICNMFENSDEYVNAVEKWLLKLIEGNKTYNIYEKNKMFRQFAYANG